MALLPNAVLGIGAPRNRQPEPERTPGAVLGLPTVASPSPAPAPGPAPAPVVAQPQAVAPVQDGNWLMNWLTSMAQNPGQPLTGPPAPAPQAPVAVPVVQPQVVAAPERSRRCKALCCRA